MASKRAPRREDEAPGRRHHKPSSVPPGVAAAAVAIIPLGRSSPTDSCDTPEGSDGPSSNAFLFGLAPDGVCLAARVAACPVSSYLTFSPLPCGVSPARRFVLCCTFLGVTPTRGYLASCPVELGLSSREKPRARSPGTLRPTEVAPRATARQGRAEIVRCGASHGTSPCMRNLVLAAVVLAGCRSPQQAAAPAPPTREAAPSPTISFEAGTFEVGSDPRVRGRSATLEADRVEVELGAFTIDRAPFAGPGGAPLLAKTRDEASAQCAARGARLCTELEWERACSGADGRVYATGETFDADACTRGACATAEGVRDLGVRYSEWTSSEVALTTSERMAVVRGAAGGDATGHRCASRRLAAPGSVDPAMAFRCCTGDADAPTYPTEPERPLFEAVELDQDAARAALGSVPELADEGRSFRFVSRATQDALVTAGANRSPAFPILESRIVRAAVRFTPARGESVIVLSGSYDGGVLVAVLYELGQGRYAHAASLKMPGEAGGVVLYRKDEGSRSLGFSTCLGCGGEDGEVRLRDDGRFIVVTR